MGRHKKIKRERDGREIRRLFQLSNDMRREEIEWTKLVNQFAKLKARMDESNRRYRKAKHDFKTNVSVLDVIGDISDLMFGIYGYTLEEVRKQDRERGLVDCRRTLSVILYRMFRFPLISIGKAVNRDHSSVIHHLETHEGIMDSDADYKDKFQRFIAGIEAMAVEPTTI